MVTIIRLGVMPTIVILSLTAGSQPAIGMADNPPHPRPTDQQIEGGVHEDFAQLTRETGDLSDEQKKKLDALSQKIIGDLKAHPFKADSDDFRKSTFAQVREVLTPDQQKKFDAMIEASRKRAMLYRTVSNLHTIGLLYIQYANQHDNSPPDLGALAGDGDTAPDTFLIAGSDTKLPADWKTMKPDQRAQWVNQNTDFIYLAGEKADFEPNFVVCYIKPERAGDQNAFLMGGGYAETKSPEESKAILAELKDKEKPAAIDEMNPGRANGENRRFLNCRKMMSAPAGRPLNEETALCLTVAPQGHSWVR